MQVLENCIVYVQEISFVEYFLTFIKYVLVSERKVTTKELRGRMD